MTYFAWDKQNMEHWLRLKHFDFCFHFYLPTHYFISQSNKRTNVQIAYPDMEPCHREAVSCTQFFVRSILLWMRFKVNENCYEPNEGNKRWCLLVAVVFSKPFTSVMNFVSSTVLICSPCPHCIMSFIGLYALSEKEANVKYDTPFISCMRYFGVEPWQQQKKRM